jgi:ABC-type proline/glycine betaine transport system permease subunit
MQTDLWSQWSKEIQQVEIPLGDWAKAGLDWLNLNFAGFFAWVSSGAVVIDDFFNTAASKPDPLIWMGILTLLIIIISRSIVLTLVTLASMLLFLNLGHWVLFIKSLLLWGVSLLIGGIFGAALGALFSYWRGLRRLMLLILSFKATYIFFTLLALTSVLFFTSITISIFTCSMVTLLFAMLYTLRSFEQVPTNLIEIGDVMGASMWKKFFKIELPYAFGRMKLFTANIALATWWMLIISGVIGAAGIGGQFVKALLEQNVTNLTELSIVIALTGILIYRLFKGRWIFALQNHGLLIEGVGR